MPFDASACPSSRLSNKIKPFTSAERAWLWAAACLAARRAGTKLPHDPTKPCSPETILSCLDHLYRSGRIDVVHARVLRRWGDRGRPPPKPRIIDRSDWQQWKQAMFELDYLLRSKHIVSGFDLGVMPGAEKIFPSDRTMFLVSAEATPSTDLKEI
ncbi:hypothetical protein [Acidiphilium sp.]|uniref:hypothetical protein n=1 Tax=Acidiphilium sp. TaxID=527 RepID=UPI003D04F5E8